MRLIDIELVSAVFSDYEYGLSLPSIGAGYFEVEMERVHDRIDLIQGIKEHPAQEEDEPFVVIDGAGDQPQLAAFARAQHQAMRTQADGLAILIFGAMEDGKKRQEVSCRA